MTFYYFYGFFRWGYNEGAKKCEMFSYGGCKGNKNHFFSEDECVNGCIDKTAYARDMCLLPRSPGPCKDMLPNWFVATFQINISLKSKVKKSLR